MSSKKVQEVAEHELQGCLEALLRWSITPKQLFHIPANCRIERVRMQFFVKIDNIQHRYFVSCSCAAKV